MRVSPKVGFVVGMLSVKPDDELILTSAKGTTIRIRVGEVRVVGRVTQGVRVMNVEADERLVAVDVVAEREPDGDNGNGNDDPGEPEPEPVEEPLDL